MFLIVADRDSLDAGDLQRENGCSSPSLSMSDVLTSNSLTTSPLDAHDNVLTMATNDDSVSTATSQLADVTLTTATAEEPFSFETTSHSTGDDMFCDGKRDAQDIVSALQGSFDFLQDSEIDDDGK